MQNEINVKNKNINNYIIELNNLKESLKTKENDISILNEQISNLKLDENYKNMKFRLDQIVTVAFKSIDQKIDFSVSFPKTKLFVRLEERLYDEYPEYKDLDVYFTVNGDKIKRFKTIQENNLKNNDKILLNIFE